MFRAKRNELVAKLGAVADRSGVGARAALGGLVAALLGKRPLWQALKVVVASLSLPVKVVLVVLLVLAPVVLLVLLVLLVLALLVIAIVAAVRALWERASGST